MPMISTDKKYRFEFTLEYFIFFFVQSKYKVIKSQYLYLPFIRVIPCCLF